MNKLNQEATLSKSTLETITGKKVIAYTYPGCAYSKNAINALKNANYSIAFSCAGRHGINQEVGRNYEVRRMHIDNNMDSLTISLQGKLPWKL